MPTPRERNASKIAGVNSNQDPRYPTKLPKLSDDLQKRGEGNIQVQSKLCKRCSRIDFDAVLSRPHKTTVGNVVTSLSPIQKWSITSCLFCSFMYSILRQKESQSEDRYPLRSFSTRRITDMGWRLLNTNVLQLMGGPYQYIVPQPDGIGAPVRMLGDIIDFKIIEGWIEICQEFHTKICSIDTPTSVPFLKLIDCQTRQIVPALDNPYVALSYTWGLQPGLQSVSDDCKSLPPNQPRTIEDAMIATLKLGLRYLWIDRYCIDQSKRQEVNQQMGMMDLIYKNAQITIIAAAGEDPTHGLPVVSSGDRCTQACATIGKHFLVSTPSDPKGPILRSKWNTRTWTYQEALFSRRRLFFLPTNRFILNVKGCAVARHSTFHFSISIATIPKAFRSRSVKAKASVYFPDPRAKAHGKSFNA